MKNLLFTLLISTMAIMSTSCEPVEDPKTEVNSIVLRAGLEKRIEQDNEFALDLFNKTLNYADESNVFISPLSVSIALGMARNGAEGETKTEMESCLKMSGLSDDDINDYYKVMLTSLPKIDAKTKLNIANSIWYRTGFPIKQNFLQINSQYFNADVRDLDFTQTWAVDTINDWCARKTNQLIKKPLDNISEDAMLYLINAIYFKGIWAKQFDPQKTVEATFTDEKGIGSKINMMRMTDTLKYAEDEKAQYLDMPYGNGAFSMTVILPKQEMTPMNFAGQLTLNNWTATLESLTEQKVEVRMPRFKVENKLSLNDVLKNMGMVKAFTDQAEFNGISNIDLLISRVIHSTFCEMNEEGTEAAAVTIIEFETTSMPLHPVFNANRPFLFVIRENSTGVILFMGKMGKVEKH